MPYPSRLSRESIINTARELIAEHGAADVSLHRIARHLNVKTPSLYRYVRNKNALLRTINEDTLAQLYAALNQTLDDRANDDPSAQLLAASHTYREFAFEHDTLYRLLFNNTQPDIVPETASATLRSVQEAVERLVSDGASDGASDGDETVATSTHGLLSIMHGFVTLEQSGQLANTANTDHAYTTVIKTYLNGLNGHT